MKRWRQVTSDLGRVPGMRYNDNGAAAYQNIARKPGAATRPSDGNNATRA